MATPVPTIHASQQPYDHARLENRAQSVGHLFRDRVAATPDKVAFLYPRAEGQPWAELTWRAVDEIVRELAAGLIALGLQVEERVAIASSTRVEWLLADNAVMCAGGATTTVYPTSMAADVAYIVADSGSKVVFAENDAQIAKLRERRAETPEVMKVVTFDGTADGEWVISLDDLRALGAERLAADPACVDDRIDSLSQDKLATIIYTSGTTGRPKGVRLLHNTWAYQCATNLAIAELRDDDLQLLWLPLSHVFGKQLSVLTVGLGMTTAVDGRLERIMPNLAQVRPTFMAAAPRIFEKAYSGIHLAMKSEGGAKYRLFRWATGVALQVDALQSAGATVPTHLAAQRALADRLVLAKIRDRFGGRIRMMVSGSAPLNLDIARWFDAVGLHIHEGYGLTETSSGATVGRKNARQLGTVGWPFPGTEVQIAEDGEVLLRGHGIMAGYHNLPEATAEVLTEDGWFHTGDIGELDEHGFLKITDRKKDLFKTSGGKYIAPSVIESTFKGLCPYVSQFLVHGAGRNYATALVALDPQAILPWAAANGLEGSSYEEIVSSLQAHDMVQRYVDELNAGLNRWETIKRFTILGQDLTIEGGELTPSLKMRRKVVAEKFSGQIDAMYAAADD